MVLEEVEISQITKNILISYLCSAQLVVKPSVSLSLITVR